MSAGPASTGNNNKSANNVPPSRRNQTNKFTNLTKDVTNPNDDTDAKLDMFNKGKKGNAKGTLALLNPIFEKGSEVTRNYYTTNVLKGKDLENFKSKSVTEQEAQYKSYLDGRLSGKTDAMGRDTPETMRGIDAKLTGAEKSTTMPVIVKKNVGGQTVQTTKAKAEEDKAKSKEYDARVTKKKGRRKNILTSARGVTKATADYSLGKKTLLGQVV